MWIVSYLKLTNLLQRDITNYVKPATWGITESKLDSSVTKVEVNINGYSIIRKMMEVLYVILEMICVLISRTFFSNSIDNAFFSRFSYQKLFFYRSSNENEFLNIFSNDFRQIDIKTNEIYLLGDFNINLLQNGKFILKENQSYKPSSSSALIKLYQEFC